MSLLLHLEGVRDEAIRLIAASDEDGHGDRGGKDEAKPIAMMIQAFWTSRLAFSTRVGTSDHHELGG